MCPMQFFKHDKSKMSHTHKNHSRYPKMTKLRETFLFSKIKTEWVLHTKGLAQQINKSMELEILLMLQENSHEL